jgi:hypothetical protein
VRIGERPGHANSQQTHGKTKTYVFGKYENDLENINDILPVIELLQDYK